MNNICDEHGAVLPCHPQSLICASYTNARVGGCMSQHDIEDCWLYILIIYIRGQCDFTIIEDQNNRCCKHKCIHVRYKILEMPRMKSVQTMRFMI